MSERVPAEEFTNPSFLWPEPVPEPEREPVDRHRGPLDDDEDAQFLERDDPRRVEVERRRGRPFERGD